MSLPARLITCSSRNLKVKKQALYTDAVLRATPATAILPSVKSAVNSASGQASAHLQVNKQRNITTIGLQAARGLRNCNIFTCLGNYLREHLKSPGCFFKHYRQRSALKKASIKDR